MKKTIAMLMTAAAVAMSAFGEWDWHMPGEVYGDVDYEYRTGIDRATRIFQEAWNCRGNGSNDVIPRFRACHAEWKKVQVQCEAENYDEDVLAYCLFMRAFSLYLSRDRHEAIKLFNEVLDLYRETPWVACPAVWWRGQTYFSMGETRLGYQDVEEVAETAAFMKNPLCCQANYMLAERAWNSGELADEEKARNYWDRCASKEYAKICADHDRAQANLTCYYYAIGDMETFRERYFSGVGEKDIGGRCNRIVSAFGWTEGQLNGGMTAQHLRRVCKKDKDYNDKIFKLRRSYADLFDQSSPMFAEAKRDFEYAMMAIDVWRPFENNEKMIKRLNKILQRVKAEQDRKTRESQLNAILRKLCGLKMFVEARGLVELFEDPHERLYLMADVEGMVGDWPKVLKIVEELLANKRNYEEEKALKNRIAGLCHHRVIDYPRAVKIYLELPDPPATLWALQDCYWKMGEKKKCYATLVEIQSMFPPEAPQAVYTMAKYYESDGDKTKAIALYRRLLSQPEWKQTSQSSAAHQDLERLGVATGGAVINAVR